LFRVSFKIKVPGWLLGLSKGQTLSRWNSEQRKWDFKGWWICLSLKEKWRLSDSGRNVLETASRVAGLRVLQ
jgi:hypothetical protein